MVGANTIIFGFHFYRIIDAPVRFTVRCIATRKFNTMIYVKFLSLQKETVCLSVSWMLIYAFPCRVTRYWLRILLLSVKSRCNYNHKHYTGVPPELILSTSIPYAPVQWATYLLHSDWSVYHSSFRCYTNRHHGQRTAPCSTEMYKTNVYWNYGSQEAGLIKHKLHNHPRVQSGVYLATT